MIVRSFSLNCLTSSVSKSSWHHFVVGLILMNKITKKRNIAPKSYSNTQRSHQKYNGFLMMCRNEKMLFGYYKIYK